MLKIFTNAQNKNKCLIEIRQPEPLLKNVPNGHYFALLPLLLAIPMLVAVKLESMNIKFIKEIEILSSRFTIVWDKNNDAGSFSWSESKIYIGIKSLKKDPLYTFHIISHELFEIILVGMGARFVNGRTGENYLFNFDHQTFENAIQIHSQSLSKFIK